MVSIKVLTVLIVYLTVSSLSQNLPFLVLGDWGSSEPDFIINQKAVAQSMSKQAYISNPEFIIAVGDNFYPNGVNTSSDSLFQSAFVETYSSTSLQVPWFIAIGNHDYYGVVQAQLDYHGDSRWQLPSRNYTISLSVSKDINAHFIFIDTSPFVMAYYQNPRNDIMRKQLEEEHWQDQVMWFNETLSTIRRRDNSSWIIVIGHHPIYSLEPTVELQEHILPLMKQFGVAAYFSGHVHNLEYLTEDGIDFFVSGAGSRVSVTGPDVEEDYEFVPQGKVIPAIFSETVAGFMSCNLYSDSMESIFISYTGQILHNTTTIRPINY